MYSINECTKKLWAFFILESKILSIQQRITCQNVTESANVLNFTKQRKNLKKYSHFPNVKCRTLTMLYMKRHFLNICITQINVHNPQYELLFLQTYEAITDDYKFPIYLSSIRFDYQDFLTLVYSKRFKQCTLV